MESNSSADAAKRNGPDLNTCKTSNGYVASGTPKIDSAVRLNGRQTLNVCMLDETTRAQIGLFAFNLMKNAACYVFNESCKWVPGAKAVAEIVSKTIEDVKLENQRNQQTVAMKQKIGASRKKNTSRKFDVNLENQRNQQTVATKQKIGASRKKNTSRKFDMNLENQRNQQTVAMKQKIGACTKKND